jgi:hypothetical protein
MGTYSSWLMVAMGDGSDAIVSNIKLSDQNAVSHCDNQ